MTRDEGCILCKAPVARSRLELPGYRVCERCGLTWHLSDVAQLEGEWEQGYYADAKLMKSHNSRVSGMAAIMTRIGALFPGRGRLLDIGAGVGQLLHAAAIDGWEVEGLEPAANAAAAARALTGATIHVETLDTVVLEAKAYDVVTVLDTLRHVADPLRFLQLAHRLVRPGGVVMIREADRRVFRLVLRLRHRSTAGKRSRHAWDYAQCFSPASLRFGLEAAGFADPWVEPSPIFIESATDLRSALARRLIHATSSTIYRCTRGRVVYSPNLLAFGRGTEAKPSSAKDVHAEGDAQANTVV